MDVYGFWRSQATFRIRIALRLKGVAYREIPVDIDKGEQFTPEFLALNPLGSLPAVIEEGEAPLTQSSALLEYIEERWPQPALLPADARGRARVRSLTAVAVSDTHPMIVPRVRRYLAEHAGFDAAQWRAWQTHWLSVGLRAIEARLAGDAATGTFCHGEAAGLADICVFALYEGAGSLGITVDGLPTIERIVARCREIPAFTESHPRYQVGFPG